MANKQTKENRQTLKSLELYLIDDSVDMSCVDFGNFSWRHMLGCTKNGTLVLIVPSLDGKFISSVFNDRRYAKCRKVKWITIA